MRDNEEFFNVKLENRYNEARFQANFPALFNFFEQQMTGVELKDLHFRHLYGFKHPTKGQCYEICYNKAGSYFGYDSHNNPDAVYFVECHIENGEFVLDNIGNPLTIPKNNGPE